MTSTGLMGRRHGASPQRSAPSLPTLASHLAKKQPLYLLLLGCLLGYLCDLGSAQQVSVCSPNNATPPLSCTPGQWVRVTGELYAPQITEAGPGGGTSCQLDTATCNTALFNVGLDANCNGPVVTGEEPCREEVGVAEARGQSQCLQDAPELATLVQYSCVKGSDVLDMCDATTRLASGLSSTFQQVHLASPAFPASSSAGNLCTCRLKGSRLRVIAVEVSVSARLPWQDDVADDSDFQAVISIRNNGNVLWKSNECADCTSVTTLNTILVSTGFQAVSELSITYSDFGLINQNVWLEITELGPDLNISCSSTPLPSDRVVTTPPPPTTTTTTPTPDPAAPATAAPATPDRPTTTSPTTSESSSAGGGRQGGATRPRAGGGGGGSGDSTTVVLVVVVLVLLVAAGVLGFILYRRRGKCGADGEKGLKPMVLAWYRDFECPDCLGRRQEGGSGDQQDTAGVDNGGFDGAAVAVGEDRDRSRDGRRYQRRQDAHSRTDTAFRGDAHSDPHHRGHRVEVVETEEGQTTIIHNDVYASHREMVGEEVARIRENKRQQRALQLGKSLGSTGGPGGEHGADDSGGSSISDYGGDDGNDSSGGSDAVATGGSDCGGNDHAQGNSRSVGSVETNGGTIRGTDGYHHKPAGGAEKILRLDLHNVKEFDYANTRDRKSNPEDNTLRRESTKFRAEMEARGGDMSENPDGLHRSPHHQHRHHPHNQQQTTHNAPYSDLPGREHGATPLHETNRKAELLSPEERDMFAALGITEDGPDLNAYSSNSLQHTHLAKNDADPNTHSLHPSKRDRAHTQEKGHPSSHVKDQNISGKFEPAHSTSKAKKAPKPEFVSDILEMSLKNIKGKRVGQEQDGEGGGGDSNEEEDGAERERMRLGGQKKQVEISEC